MVFENFPNYIHRIHFVGICGTAMGSVAAALKQQGYLVTGSDDSVYPPMSTFLEQQGVEVVTGYRSVNLSPTPDLVIIGNAMMRGNPEVEAVLSQRLYYVSLPEVIKEFFIRGKYSVVVTGTHGKTTTTSLLTWVLDQAGVEPGFLIGGIPENFGIGCRSGKGRYFVSEGDEYDCAFFDKRSKFLHYLPDLVVMNNIEFDHADIFPDLEAIKLSFKRLINIIPSDGYLVASGDDPTLATLLDRAPCKVEKFGLESDNVWTARFVKHSTRGVSFRAYQDQRSIGDFSLPLYGVHNVRNALAVIASSRLLGISSSAIQAGFSSFKNIKRRMELKGEFGGIAVIEDFAHHPTAVRVTLDAIRTRFPGRSIWALFEPRTNTTTRNIFQKELSTSFGSASHVVIGAINRPERFKPEERLSPEKLVSDLVSSGLDANHIPDVDQMVKVLVDRLQPGDLVVIMSNGKFGGACGKLLFELEKKCQFSQSAES
jgi:UDP-N-acetylmuramate: L-alanyl-gamma-D-glutamyl-meso-diaminopimelate ligase